MQREKRMKRAGSGVWSSAPQSETTGAAGTGLVEVSRRALLLGAAAPAAIGVLAACGQAGGGEAPAAAGKTTTVTYIIYAPINDPTFNYDEKLRAMMAAGNAPDTVRVAVRAYAADGVLLELDNYVQKDKSFDTSDNLPGVLDAGKWKGKLYLLVGKLGPQILFYNVRKFQEVGLPLPKEQADKGTWNFDAFVQAAEKLTNRRDTPPKQNAYGPYTAFRSWIALGGG